jgi:ubiquinone/menaquinone biosynthesis C-methylase UbiE
MEDQKQQQVEYHEREHYSSVTPREADNSNPLVAWLNTYRLRKALDIIAVPLSGKTVLCSCGGDGDEANLLEREGAMVTVADLSNLGLKAARVRNPALRCARMDAESLGFAASSFDWVFVRDGLHHLARPIQGLYELERASREGFVILEGQDSLVVRTLVMLGLGDNRDPAGGYIYRFSRREMHKIFSSIGTLARWHIYTAWLPFGSDVLRHFSSVMSFVYPLVNRPAVLGILNSRIGRCTLKGLFAGFNFLFGRWGNSLIAVVWKK